jgi:hypothetical protein
MPLFFGGYRALFSSVFFLWILALVLLALREIQLEICPVETVSSPPSLDQSHRPTPKTSHVYIPEKAKTNLSFFFFFIFETEEGCSFSDAASIGTIWRSDCSLEWPP